MMRGHDDESGEFLGPSRSEQRRVALDVLVLGETLASLAPAQLAKLPVPESLLPHIAETRRITSHGARKRQLGFLAKQMRREDEAVLDAIRDALDAGGEAARKDTALLHRAEVAREHSRAREVLEAREHVEEAGATIEFPFCHRSRDVMPQIEVRLGDPAARLVDLHGAIMPLNDSARAHDAAE